MNIERTRTWVQSVAVGVLCVTATVTFTVAGGHLARQRQPQPQPQAQASSGYVPPGVHEAEAGADIGPGSDEAQLVGSSWGE
jgi:hypothetical protein